MKRSSRQVCRDAGRNPEDPRRAATGTPGQGGVRPRHSLGKKVCPRLWRQLRQGGHGVPHGRGFHQALGCTVHVSVGGRKHWISNRWFRHRFSPPGDEPQRGRLTALQQGQARRGCNRRGWAQGSGGRSRHGCLHASRNTYLLSFSRALLGSFSLKGSTLRQDRGANEDLYGLKLNARQIVLEGKAKTPRAARELINLLQKRSPENLSN